MNGYIILEDGKVFKGRSFGASGESVGEVVFNTSMTGYQEILTDPSYASQIVTMTYPLIGNYGVNEEDVESGRIQVAGFVVKEACRYPSNYTSVSSLPDYLKENGIIGVEGVDTRAITRHIRLSGSMKAVIYAGEKEPDIEEILSRISSWPGLEGVDTVKDVTCSEQFDFSDPTSRAVDTEERFHVAAYDFGSKYNILRILSSMGCRVTVVPASTPAEEILEMNPDGVFLSNGPGDPAAVTYAVENVKKLIGKFPMFGICLGHQILTLALGGRTYKLKFGHHGGNHPVRNLLTNEIEITAQNHCFCADMESLDSDCIRMTHLNLYDKTCEGCADDANRVFSVQYHPEASPGPHDSGYLFKNFIDMMEAERK